MAVEITDGQVDSDEPRAEHEKHNEQGRKQETEPGGGETPEEDLHGARVVEFACLTTSFSSADDAFRGKIRTLAFRSAQCDRRHHPFQFEAKVRFRFSRILWREQVYRGPVGLYRICGFDWGSRPSEVDNPGGISRREPPGLVDWRR